MPKTNSLKKVPFQERFRWESNERISEGWKMAEYGGYTNIQWRPNEPFHATLRLIHMERGRSAVRFVFESPDGTRYPFFGQGLTEMLQRVTMVEGVVTATWIAVKRGANYGLELYDG